MADHSHHKAGLIFVGVCVALGAAIFVLDQGKDALGRLATPIAAPSLTPRADAVEDLPAPVHDQSERVAEEEPVAPAPAPASIVTSPAADGQLREQSRQIAETFFSVGAQGEVEALAWLSTHYAENVSFFGRTTPRSEVLRQKAAYIRRWPTRSYTIEPDSVAVTCGDDKPLCHASGIIDWSAASPERGAVASGKASFDLVTYAAAQGPVIVSETSKVIARQ